MASWPNPGRLSAEVAITAVVLCGQLFRSNVGRVTRRYDMTCDEHSDVIPFFLHLTPNGLSVLSESVGSSSVHVYSFLQRASRNPFLALVWISGFGTVLYFICQGIKRNRKYMKLLVLPSALRVASGLHQCARADANDVIESLNITLS